MKQGGIAWSRLRFIMMIKNKPEESVRSYLRSMRKYSVKKYQITNWKVLCLKIIKE